MNNVYSNRAKSTTTEFLAECFRVISTCCSTQIRGHLHFNSTDYIYMDLNKDGKYVPFVHTHNQDVEMYSEDGWFTLEEIGHWTDVAIDIVMAIAAGCGEKYGYENVLIKVKRHE